MDRKIAYEWVVTMSNGDYHLLTENQYKTYKENVDGGKIFFEDMEINPSYVASSYKRPASEEIKKKYPCTKCHTSGILTIRTGETHKNGYIPTEQKVCPDCEGTGMDL